MEDNEETKDNTTTLFIARSPIYSSHKMMYHDVSSLDDVSFIFLLEDENFSIYNAEPQQFTRPDSNDLVRELDITKNAAELLGSQLKEKKLLTTGTTFLCGRAVFNLAAARKWDIPLSHRIREVTASTVAFRPMSESSRSLLRPPSHIPTYYTGDQQPICDSSVVAMSMGGDEHLRFGSWHAAP
ncbi:hypothetical protein EVAR_103736_1 [Eumeta japonica]|uniref:Uncharacterized protein n=1 Tax=Eumeta variegata TaxID=151549 RepID=A0A4C1ZMB4_EUMVA|nr:hypothetical protein EVAR_103736_1 [Eumeta japonica]